eukprot:2322478-Pleurochrysis_carterae.AAC.2
MPAQPAHAKKPPISMYRSAATYSEPSMISYGVTSLTAAYKFGRSENEISIASTASTICMISKRLRVRSTEPTSSGSVSSSPACTTSV